MLVKKLKRMVKAGHPRCTYHALIGIKWYLFKKGYKLNGYHGTTDNYFKTESLGKYSERLKRASYKTYDTIYSSVVEQESGLWS